MCYTGKWQGEQMCGVFVLSVSVSRHLDIVIVTLHDRSGAGHSMIMNVMSDQRTQRLSWLFCLVLSFITRVLPTDVYCKRVRHECHVMSAHVWHVSDICQYLVKISTCMFYLEGGNQNIKCWVWFLRTSNFLKIIISMNPLIQLAFLFSYIGEKTGQIRQLSGSGSESRSEAALAPKQQFLKTANNRSLLQTIISRVK